MKGLRYILCLMAFVMAATISKGQDLHYTQFYSAPLMTNPALTGNFAEDYRVGGNFKQQWPWAQQANKFNYITYAMYADMGFLKGKLKNKDWIGGGLVVLHDRAGDGNLAITKILLTGAYHKVIGRGNRYYLSMGLGAGFVQKGVNYDNLYFNSQWSDNFFDRSLSSGENGSPPARYFDMNAGAVFNFKLNDDVRFSVGGAALHITKPKESFYGSSNRLGIRPVATITGSVRFTERWHIEPGFIYMSQKRAQEFLFHLMAGYTFNSMGRLDNSVLFFGLDGRVKDAVAPVVGFQIARLRVLINYDINLSSLSDASRGIGGIEFSVVYHGFLPGTTENRALPCPRL